MAYIVTIDGPCGSGKSTMAKKLAEELNIQYFNTGSLYRVLALVLEREGVSWNDEEAIAAFLKNITLTVSWEGNKQLVSVNNEVVDGDLLGEHIGDGASRVSAFGCVREFLLDAQRNVSGQNFIVEGRDTGTVVFPNADVKFYLTANLNVRANRRYVEGNPEKDSYLDVVSKLHERDFRDRNRAVAPLTCAEDAVFVDNSNLTIDQCTVEMMNAIQKRVPAFA